MSDADRDRHGAWEPLGVEDTAQLFATAPFPWWVAGGHAIDLFVGRATRSHNDIDIEMLRYDQLRLPLVLAGWELWTASEGGLTHWSGDAEVPDSVNSVWCRRGATDAWAIQVMFAASDGHSWVYRRHPAVRVPLDDVGLVTPSGIPFIRPEIELLFKAKSMRPKDEADFAVLVPALDEPRRSWLRDALTRTLGDHPWVARL